MTAADPDLGIGTIAKDQDPDLMTVKGGGLVIVIMTGDDLVPGHVVETMRRDDHVQRLDELISPLSRSIKN